MPRIVTPFAGAPEEVDDAEYAALERAGLLRDQRPEDIPAEKPVTVQTAFGHPVTVPVSEAESLLRQGLLVELDPEPPKTATDNPPSGGPPTTPPAPPTTPAPRDPKENG
jgi:hypothetical protein